MAATSSLFEPVGLDCKPSIVLNVCCYLTEMSLYDPETMLTSRYLSEFVCKFIEAVEEPTDGVEVLKKVCFMAYITFLFLAPLGTNKRNPRDGHLVSRMSGRGPGLGRSLLLVLTKVPVETIS